MKRVILLSVSILLISLAYSFAEVPCKINYQGRLIKDNVPVDGTKKMVFSIYGDAVGPPLLWTSGEVDITVYNGLFRYVIGSDGGDLSSIDWTAGQALYLEVKVGTDILTPREELYAYPYAINSHLLEGKTTDYFLNTSAETQKKDGGLNIMGNVGIGTTSPDYALDLQRSGGTLATVGWAKVLHLRSSGALVWDKSGGSNFFFAAKNTEGIYQGLLPTDDGTSAPNYIGRIDEISGDWQWYKNVYINGNLGIGLTNPSGILHIFDGNKGIMFGRRYGNDIQGCTGASGGNIDNLVLQSYGGNVGIGTRSPGATLEVAGDVKITGGLKPNYDSGWFSVSVGTQYTLNHNLGTTDFSNIMVMNKRSNGEILPNMFFYAAGRMGADFSYGTVFKISDINTFKVKPADSDANYIGWYEMRVKAWK